MIDIERLAKEFRYATKAACENGEMRKHPPFSGFPNECCDLTCDLLGQYLFENNIETYQMNGKCKYDAKWHHVWLLTKDEIVIDITGDQFINKLVSPKEVKEVHVGIEGKIHRIFDLERKPEKNTVFTDPNKFTDFGGRPNKRQKTLMEVYEIICQYL